MNQRVLEDMWASAPQNALVYVSCVFVIYMLALVITVMYETYKVEYHKHKLVIKGGLRY